MTRRRTFRGQPVVVLGLLMSGWFGVRVMTWQPPFLAVTGGNSAWAAEPAAAVEDSAPATPAPRDDRPTMVPEQWRGLPEGPVLPPVHPEPPAPLLLREPLGEKPLALGPLQPVEPRHLIGHHIMLAAAFSQMEVPAALRAYLDAPLSPAQKEARPAPAGIAVQAPDRGTTLASSSRWSADTWLLLRDDTITPIAAGRPSYGRSQAGGVVRYRLAPSSGHRPAVYARVSRAITGIHETEVAAGLAARPVPAVPVSLAAELRVSDSPGGRELRPSAFAVTELPPVALPFGLRGEAYLQGGYVGGDHATAFVDGQARVDRKVARIGSAEMRAGAGVWGGAQEDASRLDVGPSASVSLKLGDTSSRLAVDYRIRVAGDAEPVSGPALTISAGF